MASSFPRHLSGNRGARKENILLIIIFVSNLEYLATFFRAKLPQVSKANTSQAVSYSEDGGKSFHVDRRFAFFFWFEIKIIAR